MYDKNCKWHRDCGYDFCHGEGVCPDFAKKKQKSRDSVKPTWCSNGEGYYVDDPEGEIVGINHYCMNCGKRLEVEP